jgi:hypothetical protein
VNTRQRIDLLKRTLAHQERLRKVARNRGQAEQAKAIAKRIQHVRALLRALETLG